MNWKEHLWIGIISSSIFSVAMYLKYNWFGADVIPQLLAVIFLSGLVPDLDHENGKLHQWLIGLGLLLALAGLGFMHFGIGLIANSEKLIMSGVLLSASAFFMGEFSHHRGFWHSIPAAIIYGGIVAAVLQNIHFGFVGFIGYYSHLAADSIPFKMK